MVKINIPAILADKTVELINKDFFLPLKGYFQYKKDWDVYLQNKITLAENNIADFANKHNLDKDTVRRCYVSY